MGKYSCAIGGCPEKSYAKSPGVKFFYLATLTDENVKTAWKDKILSTRADISCRNQINDVAICSRHFVDGDKRNLPTLIPRMNSKKEVIWPEQKTRRTIIRKLPFASPPSATKQPTKIKESTPTRQPVSQSDTPLPLKDKLMKLQSALNSTPPKEVQQAVKRKHSELEAMSPTVRTIVTTMPTMSTPAAVKSPPLSKKLSIMKDKIGKEPNGVSEDTTTKTPIMKDETIKELKRLLDQERAKSRKLELDLEESRKQQIFGIDRFKGNPLDFSFYTGLPDYMTFLAFCDFLQPERHRVSSIYYQTRPNHDSYTTIRGREPVLSVQNQIFLVLCRLRQGYRELDLAHRFGISQSTVSDIFCKWIKHMEHVLSQLPLWPPKSLVQSNMPQSFKDLGFDKTRCIVDCTEVFLQQPSSNLVLQSVLFSSYKNHHTAKGLVAIAPHGPITFVSDLYVGSASDIDITQDCGILDLLEPNDHVMADKGFEIQRLLDERQVRVDHPPILRGVKQMSVEQETVTRRIARLRIHVERAIERVKNFRILNESFPYRQWSMLNCIWKVCAFMTHFQPPLVDKI